MLADSRVLKDVGFGWQGAVQITSNSFVDYNLARTSKDISWCHNGKDKVDGLEAYRIAERFLLDKQLFFSNEEPIPSFPPVRGRLKNPVKIFIERNGNCLVLDFKVDIGVFDAQNLLLVFFYCNIPEISLDDVILLKEYKWFKSTCKDESLQLVWDGIGQVASISDLMFSVLEHAGLTHIEKRSWPIFDYVQLSEVGPSVGPGPNLDNSLDLQEHWGLLVGDEGYRLIDYKQDSYRKLMESDDRRFRGRFVFLYQFSPTSCLIFYHRAMDAKRRAWAERYKEKVANIPDLVDYIGFKTDVPGLTDGIPIMVEICLIRYVELKRIDELMASTYLWEPLRALTRAFGSTRLERAVSKLHRLDLYQDSALWIIGGKYTDLLFEYERLRRRIEKSIAHRKTVAIEMRSLSIALVSLLVALAALGVSWFG